MNDRFTPEQKATLDRIYREGQELKAKREQEAEEEYERNLSDSQNKIEWINTKITLIKEQISLALDDTNWVNRLEELIEKRCEYKASLAKIHDDYQEECYYGR